MWRELKYLIDELFEELDKLWNSSDDPRYKGENPACYIVLDEIEKNFLTMSDDEIKEALDSLPKERYEQLYAVFQDMIDEHEFMKDYIVY
jgi:hypothetical protein